ncbi:MAG: SET domain-containing protein [Acidimicrobiales bacterium]
MEPALRVKSIPGKGRGVVAARAFDEGDVLERAPVLVITAEDWEQAGTTILARYCFGWREGAGDSALVLGHCSLLNHSYAPNAWACSYIADRAIEFVALRDIAEGDEITINYNGDPDSDGPMDFRVRRR